MADASKAMLSRKKAMLAAHLVDASDCVVWSDGTPVIVNARCDVLLGQVRRADGGLYYRSSEDFAADGLSMRAAVAARSAPSAGLGQLC